MILFFCLYSRAAENEGSYMTDMINTTDSHRSKYEWLYIVIKVFLFF